MDRLISKKDARHYAKTIVDNYRKFDLNIKNHFYLIQKELALKVLSLHKQLKGTIAIYKNDYYEIETRYLAQILFDKNIKIALPDFSINETKMSYYRIQNINEYDSYKINSINENICIKENKVLLKELKIIVVPLLGISMQNYRLGRGGGNFDKLFFNKKNKYYLSMLFTKKQKLNFIHSKYDLYIDNIIYLDKFIN